MCLKEQEDVSFLVLILTNNNCILTIIINNYNGFYFKIDIQCLQAVVQSKTKTLHAKCHEMLLQRMNMFKNAKALVSKYF